MIYGDSDDMKDILDPNETIDLYIKQKFYHLAIDIDSVVITNQRVILRHPHDIGLKRLHRIQIHRI